MNADSTHVAELPHRKKQGGALRAPRAGACARPLAFGGPGRRAPTHALAPPLISHAHPARNPVLHSAVFLGNPVSRSRPPCLGRSLRSRRMRSAAPNLDTPPARQGLAPRRKTGKKKADADR